MRFRVLSGWVWGGEQSSKYYRLRLEKNAERSGEKERKDEVRNAVIRSVAHTIGKASGVYP